MGTQEPQIIDLFELLSSSVDRSYLQQKLEILSNRPLLVKNTPRYVLNFLADWLNHFVGRSVNIAIVSSQSQMDGLLKGLNKENKVHMKCATGGKFDLNGLKNSEYEKSPRVWEEGQYSVLGDIVIVWPFGFSNPIRISLWEDEIESISSVNPKTFTKIEDLDEFSFSDVGSVEGVQFLQGRISKDGVYKYPLLFSDRQLLVEDKDIESLDLGIRTIPGLDYYSENKVLTEKIFQDYKSRGYRVIFSSKEIFKLQDSYNLEGVLINNSTVSLDRGFVWNSIKVLVLTDYELFGRVNLEKDNENGDGEISEWLKRVSPGDFLVHEDHGIGVFEKILVEENDSYIEIKYAGKDRLLVPLSQSQKVSKYVGGRGRIPSLTSLNSGVWGRITNRVREDTEKIAKELLQLYALREIASRKSPDFTKDLRAEFDKFVKDFEYVDTYDQRVASSEIFDDISKGKLMDRLLVGDVGFGKTEMAMRAAFLAVNLGFQVAVLAPTTILVEQHSSVFKNRLSHYGMNIASLSRFLKGKEKQNILDDLEKGSIDIVIGTQSLLQKRVFFKNLGLIIIDEEQKFGVKQKEELKTKRLESHVLSMSATPIPRTLSMSLSGIRDISTLLTPPEGRKAIHNSYKVFDWDDVQQAIGKELERGGQVYFLHNNVVDIKPVLLKLSELFPQSSIAIAHGQMKPEELSRVMHAFSQGKIDILLCTTIIENGIDIPNVNTLIVDDAARFGLSQLYQIRGRIGRSNVQAYAYFFYKSMKGNVGLRLDALMEAQDLGSGFILANRDLEIRGAGDMLGKSQSGSINAVGYGMYMSMLAESIEAIKKKESSLIHQKKF